MKPKSPIRSRRLFSIIFCSFIITTSTAQTAVSLSDLSFFKTPAKSWSIVGDVTADLAKPEFMSPAPGAGVLLNLIVNKNGADLYSNAEFGDIDLEMDYMMSKNANSGIYLQGRYEYQLFDSWLVKKPTSADNGGIYEREGTGPNGTGGYQGHAPRQNVSRAPGLWQHVKISFQAPRFNSGGQKVENAKMLRVDLNGVMIHENIDLEGPTRGGGNPDSEKPLGPLRLQGDHGNVAFRNIRITTFDKPVPVLSEIKYAVYKGRYNADNDITKLQTASQGSLLSLSASTINNLPNEFFIKYTGTLKIDVAGTYAFNVAVPGGRGILKVNGLSAANRQRTAEFTLPTGNLPFELLYIKGEDWKNRSLSIMVTGPGIRQFILGDPVPIEGYATDPIYVEAPVNTILRSFVNLSPGVTSVHAVSVGSPEQVHYTYDLDCGGIVLAWRGGFLDATPMWHNRGNGSSVPVGAVVKMGKPALFLSKMANVQAPWSSDTTGSGFRPRGYKLNKADVPTFLYQLDGSMVEDAITVIGAGQGLRRDITVKNAAPNLYARLAEAGSIQAMEGGLYIIENKSYYLRIDDAGGAKAVIREINGRQELLIPVQSKLSYTMLY